MKPWLKRTLIGLAGVSVLFGGIAACSHRHHGHDWTAVSAEDAANWRERFVDRAARELQLDDGQKQQLGAVFDRLREQRNAMIGTTTDPRAELRALIAGERFDSARAQALIEQKTAALRDGSPQTIASLAAFYDGLKPEQQQRLRELLDRRHRRWS
jgi:Spy/CpxP family protein refolding chaperone